HQQLLDGADFAELAAEHSEDGAASRGGELGYFGRKKMVPEFEKAAFALEKEGDISGPVKTQFGYHLVKLTGRKPAGPVPFGMAKRGIISGLQTSVTNQVWQEKLVKIRASSDLAIEQEIVDSLKRKYFPENK
ncbi:MAG: peptidylprolyl isomerase, partial [Thiohalobacterales bacterium]|nr:peptidylprolyl isomerase [Thiohalobacterales bacterium]